MHSKIGTLNAIAAGLFCSMFSVGPKKVKANTINTKLRVGILLNHCLRLLINIPAHILHIDYHMHIVKNKMRFYQGKTQMEVADEFGISQAQVSRLEKDALKSMRRSI